MIPHLESHLSFVLQGLWRASWQASVLAIIVLLAQALLGKRLGGRGRFALWAVVLLRLLMPVAPESRWSVFNLTQGWNRASETSKVEADPVSAPFQPLESEIPIIVIGSRDANVSAKPQAVEGATLRAQSAAPPRAAPIASRMSWSPIALLFAAWIAGVLTLGVRIVHICFSLSRTIRRLVEVTDPDLLLLVASCASTLNLRRIPRVFAGSDVQTPAVVGLFQTKLLLPADVLAHCDDREIRLIILHELAHLKRHDLAGNWLIAIATVLHWFNPVVWMMAARMRADRELACDELVLSASSGDAKAYGLTLVKLIELLSPRPAPRHMIGIVGILESTTPMQRRVRMIAQFDPKLSSKQSQRWIWTASVLGLLGAIALTDAVRGADKPKPSSAAPATRPAMVDVVVDGAQSDADLQAKLLQRIPELTLDSMPFGDVIDLLRDRSQANLVVNWRALEAAGIDRSAQVTLRLKNVTLRQAMDHVLNDVGGGSVRLDAAIDRDAIVVSTEEDLARNTKTVAYDVHELVEPTPDRTSAVQVEQLIKIVQDLTVPETWKDNGGTVGSIRELNGKLIVQQTSTGHEKVAELLKLLKVEHQAPVAGMAPNTFGAAPGGYAPGMAMNPGRFGEAAVGPQATAPRTVVSDEEIETANRQALAILKKKIPEVKFDGVALSDVLDFYRDFTSANIVANWRSLEEAGIDRNAPISLQLKDATFESVLQATLRQLGSQRLVMVIDRGVIIVTTQLDVPGYMLTKTYEVRDLVGDDAQEMAPLVTVMQNLTQEGGLGVQAFGTKMIVTALPNAHEQVDKLLADLRKNPTTRPVGSARRPRGRGTPEGDF